MLSKQTSKYLKSGTIHQLVVLTFDGKTWKAFTWTSFFVEMVKYEKHPELNSVIPSRHKPSKAKQKLQKVQRTCDYRK